MKRGEVTDRSIERMVSGLLLTGVLISASFVFAGGVYYVLQHGAETVNYRVFQSQPRVDRLLNAIVRGALGLRARSVIQFGILLLIATPILRVGACLVGFSLERDRRYVVVTAIVLAVLLYSLISGGVAG